MILIIEGIFISLNSTILSNLYQQRVKQNLKQDNILIKRLAEDYRHDRYKDVFSESDLRFTLIDYNGNVVFDSKNVDREEHMDNHLKREEVQEAINGEEGFAIRKSKTIGHMFAYYTTGFTNDFDEKYIIRTSSDYSKEIRQIREFLFVQIMFFLALNFAIHFFYKNYIKRDFYNKIKKMKRFLEIGEKEKINYLKEEKWFFEFWDVLKEWQGRNLRNIERLERERKTLSLVISSVDIFIGLLNKEGKFVVKNNVLSYLVDSTREKYLECIKYIEIIDIIKKGVNEKTNVKEEIYVQGLKRYFIVTLKQLEFSNQVLITIKDITSTRKAVEVQKNFISNVSHELKTPLTNIKGYLIALEDAPDPMREKFLKVIKGNVEKLENIVLDFLNISKIENSNILNVTQVSIEKIKSNIQSTMEMLLKNKNASIKYQIEVSDENNYIRVDFDKITMILKNLIENGIIYNKSERPEIKVKITEEQERYNFSVSDNGIGIPADEQYKVFERFYRVDRARTSNLGGTGLGLAIVKSLIEKYGGKIAVISEEGKGTTFEFYISK